MRFSSIGLCLLLALSSLSLFAKQDFDYKLIPQKVAENTYVFIGASEDFSVNNGGNIVNTGFIVTSAGVVVIDTGPSYIYGQQMRTAIQSITDKKIAKVIITHHHPDHLFGNQAFKDVPIFATAETVASAQLEAEGFLDNLYRMVGYWMKDTEVIDTLQVLPAAKETLGEHELHYITLPGHTRADLMVFDKTSGVLFTGDLVFNNRTPTTPHAAPEKWQDSLQQIAKMDFKVLVPGHGPVSRDNSAIEQTRDYLSWLEETISAAVEQGLDMNETLNLKIPERFQSMHVIEKEYTRSVTHRFPYYEKQLFD